MMGTGNLTELTEADTLGIQALLMGIVSELRITNILTTQVSAHASGVIREADRARRGMYAARGGPHRQARPPPPRDVAAPRCGRPAARFWRNAVGVAHTRPVSLERQ